MVSITSQNGEWLVRKISQNAQSESSFIVEYGWDMGESENEVIPCNSQFAG